MPPPYRSTSINAYRHPLFPHELVRFPAPELVTMSMQIEQCLAEGYVGYDSPFALEITLQGIESILYGDYGSSSDDAYGSVPSRGWLSSGDESDRPLRQEFSSGRGSGWGRERGNGHGRGGRRGSMRPLSWSSSDADSMIGEVSGDDSEDSEMSVREALRGMRRTRGGRRARGGARRPRSSSPVVRVV